MIAVLQMSVMEYKQKHQPNLGLPVSLQSTAVHPQYRNIYRVHCLAVLHMIKTLAVR